MHPNLEMFCLVVSMCCTLALPFLRLSWRCGSILQSLCSLAWWDFCCRWFVAVGFGFSDAVFFTGGICLRFLLLYIPALLYAPPIASFSPQWSRQAVRTGLHAWFFSATCRCCLCRLWSGSHPSSCQTLECKVTSEAGARRRCLLGFFLLFATSDVSFFGEIHQDFCKSVFSFLIFCKLVQFSANWIFYPRWLGPSARSAFLWVLLECRQKCWRSGLILHEAPLMLAVFMLQMWSISGVCPAFPVFLALCTQRSQHSSLAFALSLL